MKTQKVYEQVFQRLLAQSGLSDVLADGGVELCHFLAGRVARGEISWSTAKQYASAIRWRLRQAGSGTDEFDNVWSEAHMMAKSVPKRRRKSTRRVRISKDVVQALETQASVKEPASFGVAVSLFYASLLLGLRPCEWASARWVDKARTRLVVRNAKAASTVLEHGPFAGRLWVRGNGAERVLKLTDDGIEAGVQDLVDEVIENEKKLPWSSNRKTIWRSFKRTVAECVDKKTLPAKFRHLTIYSARHQFAADAKKVMDVGAGEVAGAMGHSAVRTAVSGYGRRKSGGAFRPSALPDPASVEAVRSKELRPARPEKRATPALRPGL